MGGGQATTVKVTEQVQAARRRRTRPNREWVPRSVPLARWTIRRRSQPTGLPPFLFPPSEPTPLPTTTATRRHAAFVLPSDLSTDPLLSLPQHLARSSRHFITLTFPREGSIQQPGPEHTLDSQHGSFVLARDTSNDAGRDGLPAVGWDGREQESEQVQVQEEGRRRDGDCPGGDGGRARRAREGEGTKEAILVGLGLFRRAGREGREVLGGVATARVRPRSRCSLVSSVHATSCFPFHFLLTACKLS